MSKMKDDLIGREESKPIPETPELKLMRQNIERLERIANCLRRQIVRLGGDPSICDLEEKK